MKNVSHLETLNEDELAKYKEELNKKAEAKNYPIRYILTITNSLIILTLSIKGKQFNPLIEVNYIDHKSDKQGFGLITLRGLKRTNSKNIFSYSYSQGNNIITLVVPNTYLLSDIKKLDPCFIDITEPFKLTHFNPWEIDQYPKELEVLHSTYEVANYHSFISEMLLNYVYYNEIG